MVYRWPIAKMVLGHYFGFVYHFHPDVNESRPFAVVIPHIVANTTFSIDITTRTLIP